MLFITGVVDGKKYQEALVTKDELLKIFGVELPNRPFVRFESVKQKKDRFGQPAVGRGFTIPAVIDANFQGDTVTIAYSRRNRPTRDGDYSQLRREKSLRFRGASQFISLDGTSNSDQEMAAFLQVHPYNETSPLKGKRVLYRTDNPELAAKAKVAEARATVDVLSQIISGDLDENLVRTKAEGIGVSTFHRHIDEIQADLINRATSNREAFVKAWNSSNVTLNGLIKRLENEKILRRKNSFGQISVKVDDEIAQVYMGGPVELCAFESNVPDPITEIRRAIIGRGESFIKTLSAILNDGGATKVELSDDLFTGKEEKKTTSRGAGKKQATAAEEK